MKITVHRPVEVDIASVRIVLPVKYDEDDMPHDFPFRKGDMWEVTIDADTGKIRDWPGLAFDLHMKVTDAGSYYVYDRSGVLFASREEDYVPDYIPGSYGDYVELVIAEDGTITNWEPSSW